MATIIVYTKPGCLTGMKQLDTLKEAGHVVDVRSILDHAWDADELRGFFGALPVKWWFNPYAPRVKSGEVDPCAHDSQTAVAAMLADPLLIRRPLLQVGGEKRCGFDVQEIHAWIGLSSQACEQHVDLQSCSGAVKDCAQ